MKGRAQRHTNRPPAGSSVTGVILALDVGRARIGVARGELGSALAFGRGWIERRGERADVAAVKALADEAGAELVVVGLPRTTRGPDSKQTALARAFATALERAGVHVALEDERFTTALAEQRLREAPAAGPRRSKGAVDEASAVLILESYLQRHLERDEGSAYPGDADGGGQTGTDATERGRSGSATGGSESGER